MLISPSPRAPSSLLKPFFPEAFPAAVAVPRCHDADVILGHDCPFPILSESPLPCRTWAAARSAGVFPFLAESQDQLGLIRQEIRSLQEELPLLDVEEKVGAFLNNATSVLEEYREPIIAWDGLRWVRGWVPSSVVWRVLRLPLLQLLEVGACWVVGLWVQGSQRCALQTHVPLPCCGAWDLFSSP